MPPPEKPAEGSANGGSDADWVAALPVAELEEGSTAEVVVGDLILALIKCEGEVYAIDGLCAHQGGPLGKGALDGCTLTCPWHGWQYDVRTGHQLLSETIRQRRYATRIEGDTIWVDVSRAAP